MPIKTLRFGAILGLTVALALCDGARADVVIEASVDGGPLQVLVNTPANPSPADGPGTGQVSWTGWISKTSHSTGSSTSQTFFLNTASTAGTTQTDPSQAGQTGATTLVQELTGVTGTHTIELVYAVSNYPLPTPETVMVSSSLSGTVNATSNVSNLSFQSFIDPNNGLPAGGSAFQIFSGGTSNNNTSSGVSTLSPIGNMTPLNYDLMSTPFSLTQIVSITLNGPRQGMNFNTNTAVIAAVPEPGTIALVLSAGLPLLIMRAWRRKSPLRP